MNTSMLDRGLAVVDAAPVTHHRTETVDGVNIFYREAGPADAPVVLLLHGFPTSQRTDRRARAPSSRAGPATVQLREIG
jgi:hypothetical protein